MVESFFDAVANNRSLQVPSDPDSGLCGGIPEDSMHLIRDGRTDGRANFECRCCLLPQLRLAHLIERFRVS